MPNRDEVITGTMPGWASPAGIALLVAFLAIAFVLAAVNVRPRLSEVAGALAFFGVVGMGLLYAWRPSAPFDA